MRLARSGGSLAPELQYAQLRYNGYADLAGAQVYDSHFVGAVAQSRVAEGWHVMTMIKSPDPVTFRLDGREIATAEITSTLPFTAEDFMIGGGLPPTSSPSAGQRTAFLRILSVNSRLIAGSVPGPRLISARGSGGNPIGIFSANGSQPPSVAGNFSVTDTITGATTQEAGQAYTGPVTYLASEYVAITQDSLNITSSVPNAFIVTGAGNDAVDISKAGGSNVISAGGGSNFITSGAGNNTLFLDIRSAMDVWITSTDFHAGDAITLYGMTPDQMYSWWDNLGAVGYTGLTMMVQVPGQSNATLTMTGYSTTDLGNGRLSLAYGDQGTANPYLVIQGH